MGRVQKKRYNEPIRMQTKRFGYFPKVFVWHGRRYDVKRVERAWEVSRHSPRRCFRVHTIEGIFDLYQDLRANTWHLEKIVA